MLVIDRERDELVYVDGPCWIKLVELTRRRIKLGFVAPRETTILRREVMTEAQVGWACSPVPEGQAK